LKKPRSIVRIIAAIVFLNVLRKVNKGPLPMLVLSLSAHPLGLLFSVPTIFFLSL
jgi:hypothetical protein